MLLTSVLPVFALIFCGWLAGRTGLMGRAASEALNSFVFYCALPVMMFKAIAATDLDKVLDPVIILFWIGLQLLIMAVSGAISVMAFGRNIAQSMVGGLTAIFANTGYMGIPLVLAIYGEDAVLPAIIVTVAQTTLLIPASLLMLDVMKSRGNGDAGPKQALQSIITGLVKNPIVLGTVAGLCVTGFGIPQPAPMVKFVDILAPAAGPCALFAIGLFLAGQKLRDGAGEVAMLSLIKLVAHPVLLVAGMAMLTAIGLGFDPVTRDILLIMAALPAGATAFVVAQAHQVSVDRSSGTILVTTIVSIVTVSVILTFFLQGAPA